MKPLPAGEDQPHVKITARGLNRATLGRQLLLRREALGVTDAMRGVVALQAQAPPSPYLALWNRLAGFDPADLDAAFASGEMVKATLMRITLHAVHAEDYQRFREAMEPSLRTARIGDLLRVSDVALASDDGLVAELLDHAAHSRTAAEIETWLAERLGAQPNPGAWRRVRAYAPLVHAPMGGPWSFGVRPSFVAAHRRP